MLLRVGKELNRRRAKHRGQTELQKYLQIYFLLVWVRYFASAVCVWNSPSLAQPLGFGVGETVDGLGLIRASGAGLPCFLPGLRWDIHLDLSALEPGHQLLHAHSI